MKDYIEKYRQLTLQIEGLSPALLLHGFLFGLRNRIKGEIERKSPSTMDEALKLAEKSGDLDWNTYGSKYGSWDSKVITESLPHQTIAHLGYYRDFPQ